MKNKPEPTAAAKLYHEKIQSVNTEIVLLRGKLLLHQDSFLKDQRNYGYAGDLARIENLLKEINQTFQI